MALRKLKFHPLDLFAMDHPASKITDFGYTTLYVRQASPELGGAPIMMSDVSQQAK